MTNPTLRNFIAVAILLGGVADSPIAKAGAVDERRATGAALRAIADHWEAAEVEGDVAYLEPLLLPEYRSIDSKGVAVVAAQRAARR